jgi:hypothetical protein
VRSDGGESFRGEGARVPVGPPLVATSVDSPDLFSRR